MGGSMVALFFFFFKILNIKRKSYKSEFVFLSGLATRLPQPKDLVKFAESCMYTPAYRSYR